MDSTIATQSIMNAMAAETVEAVGLRAAVQRMKALKAAYETAKAEIDAFVLENGLKGTVDGVEIKRTTSYDVRGFEAEHPRYAQTIENAGRDVTTAKQLHDLYMQNGIKAGTLKPLKDTAPEAVKSLEGYRRTSVSYSVKEE